MKYLKERGILTKEEKIILTRCRCKVKKIDPTAQVILYGSRARRDHEPDSDYDLLILTDGEASLKREDVFRERIYDIELETGAMLSVFLFNNKDWQSPLYKAMPFCQNVEKEGVIL
jgi:predicted nucleotidyltransferase